MAPPNRLGLVLGAGGFARTLQQQVMATGYEAIIYSFLPHHVEGKLIPISDPEECIRIFLEDGVSKIVHAGDFGASLFLGSILKDPSRVVATARLLLSATDVRGRLFQPYEQGLAAANIVTRAARDLFDTYLPLPGQMGSVAPPPGWAEQMHGLVQVAASVLKQHQPLFGVAQSLIFDDGERVAVEKAGTDALLRSLPRLDGPDTVRIMIKLLPEGLPAALDAPTIGPTTIQRATRAGVRLIALDVAHGQIIDRDVTITAADTAGITLFGI